MRAIVKIALHDVADAEALVRRIEEFDAELEHAFPGLLALRVVVEPSEARVELLFAQHQVIVERAGASPDAALQEVVVAAKAELERVALRDPSVAPSPPAIRSVRPLPLAA